MTHQRIQAARLVGQHGAITHPAPRQEARLQWRPATDWTPLDPPARPELIAALRRVFGEPPVALTDAHLPELRAMAAVGGAHYGRLAKLVEERGSIEISVEEIATEDDLQ